MAEPRSAQELVNMGYYGYRGWNDAEALADFRATGGSGKGSPTIQSSGFNTAGNSTTFNPIDTAKQLLQFQQEANQPYINQLQQSIPEIQQAAQTQTQALQSTEQPLKERYQQVLDQIKGAGQREEQRVSTATAREYGKRGIPLTSGVYDEALQEKLQPVSERFAGLASDTSFGFENLLRQLGLDVAAIPTQTAERVANIRSAIASLGAGGGANAVNQAVQLLGLQQGQQQFATTEERLSQAQQLSQRIFEEISKPESAANIQNIQSQIANRGSSSSDLASLLNLFGGGGVGTSPTERRPTTNPGAASAVSPGGQWYWDYSSGSWIPIVD